jgi:hypothetical protein
MNKALSQCPVCGGELVLTRLHCHTCDTTIEGTFSTDSSPFDALSAEQVQYVLAFVRCEGRFNRLEEELKLSYPTLRSRLMDIIRALGYEPSKDDSTPKVTSDDRRRILEDLEAGRISASDAQRKLRGQKEDISEEERI